mgnify:CR=1 FL=1
MRKGDVGPFFDATDTTYLGPCPVNTDGGQMSAGQLNPAGASGSQQIAEAARQIMRQAGERQLPRADIGMSNH